MVDAVPSPQPLSRRERAFKFPSPFGTYDFARALARSKSELPWELRARDEGAEVAM